MNVREKLVEMIGSTEYGNGSLVGNNFQKGFIEKIATHLIANGVTVQDFGLVNDMNNGERCNFENNHDAICGSTNLPCIKCNPGGCNNRKEGPDNG